jgi:hypothetical protein
MVDDGIELWTPELLIGHDGRACDELDRPIRRSKPVNPFDIASTTSAYGSPRAENRREVGACI